VVAPHAKRADLAREVEALPPLPRPVEKEGTLHMQPSGH
jgi:hypothetical protein